MDSIETLVRGAKDLTTVKYLLSCTVALTLYDYLLTFNDEIRYVWRGRKTWIFYLYMSNRILLIVYQFWQIYYISNPRNSETVCLTGYYVQVLLIMFFLFSSDIFITLRIYAITSGKKIFAIYFGTLALTRLTVALATSFLKSPVIANFPPLPIDATHLCVVVIDLQFKLVPNSIATAFESSAFLVIAWYTYRNKSTLKFSALIRTMVTEATIYFLAMVALQTYVQLSLSLTKGTDQNLPPIAYGLINPILTMRFAVSLKRSADPNSEREWQLMHFSAINFVSAPPRATNAHPEDIEMDPVDPVNHELEFREP